MDEAGISCFTTPTASEFEAIREKARQHLAAGGPLNRLPHANQIWMLVGFELFRVLESAAECIEVFPQAIVRALGAGGVHKTKSGAVEAQLQAAAAHTGWPSADASEPGFHEIAWSPGHDRLDAYLSAWVAALEESERVAYGSPPDDVIWVPQIAAREPVEVEISPRPGVAVRKQNRSNTREHGQARLCPACDFTFRSWPSGWDAHAAHRCTGLASEGAEARKVEFKRRFGVLFVKP
jgi:hypothetical protein